MEVIEGPEHVAVETINAIVAEIAARNRGLWIDVRGEILVYFDDHFVINVTIPDDDPFEPSRLNRIFDIAERVIVAHVPCDIPLRDDTETWTVRVETEGDRASIDVIWGGRKRPPRTERLSDGVGPGARTTAPSSHQNGTGDMDLDTDDENPLWDYLDHPAELAELIAEGEVLHVSTPIFHAAVHRGDVDLARLLLTLGDSHLLHAFDDLHCTALMVAAHNGDIAMVRFLLEAGSDVNAHDEDQAGDTALELAVDFGHYDLAKLLVEHGADPTIPTWMGRTALDRAAKRKRMPELYALLKAAADARPRGR